MKMNKKIFLTGILLLWGAVCLLAQPVAERCSHEYVSFQGMTREYWMYVPENLPAGAPLMVALHGYGGSALKMKPGLIDLAQEKGFALLRTGFDRPEWKTFLELWLSRTAGRLGGG